MPDREKAMKRWEEANKKRKERESKRDRKDKEMDGWLSKWADKVRAGIVGAAEKSPTTKMINEATSKIRKRKD